MSLLYYGAMITIILPTVNKGQLLDAIKSVQLQSSGNWKLIIGGDGFLPDFTSEDDRIEVIEIPRKGEAGLARNCIAQFADTEWIGFLDDDDELDPQYVHIFERHKDSADVIIFCMLNYGEILPPMGRHEIRHGRVGISFAMKTELLKEYPFDGQGGGEDYRMLYTLQNIGANIVFTDYLAYYVRPYLTR